MCGQAATHCCALFFAAESLPGRGTPCFGITEGTSNSMLPLQQALPSKCNPPTTNQLIISPATHKMPQTIHQHISQNPSTTTAKYLLSRSLAPSLTDRPGHNMTTPIYTQPQPPAYTKPPSSNNPNATSRPNFEKGCTCSFCVPANFNMMCFSCVCCVEQPLAQGGDASTHAFRCCSCVCC